MRGKSKDSKVTRSTSRLPLWFLIAGSLVLFVIPSLLLLVLHLPIVQKQLIAHVVQRLKGNAEVEINFERYQWQPFSRLRLVNLRVQSSGKEVVKCEKVQLNYRLSWDWPYLYPKELHLERPFIRLKKDEKGTFSLLLPEMQKAENTIPHEDPIFWVRYPLPAIHIVSGDIEAEQDGKQVLALRNVNARFSFHVVHGPSGPRLEIDLGQWQSQVTVPELGKIEILGGAELREGILFVKSLVSTIEGKGWFYLQGRTSLNFPHDSDLEIRLGSVAAEMFPAFGEKWRELKEISGQIHLQGRAGVWTLEHELQSNLGDLNGSLHLESVGETAKNLRWTTQFSQLRIPTLQSSFPRPLHGRLELAAEGFELGTMNGQVKVRIEPLKDEIFNGLDLDGFYHEGVLTIKNADINTIGAKFSISALADLQGLWDPTHEGTIEATLRSASNEKAKKMPRGENQAAGGFVHFQGRYEAGDFLNCRNWSAELDADLYLRDILSIKVSGKYKKELLDLVYRLEGTDLRRLTRFFPGTEQLASSFTGEAINSRGTLRGRWPDFVWEGEVGSARVEFGSIRAEQISLKGHGPIVGKEAARKLNLKAQTLILGEKNLGSIQVDLEQQKDNCLFVAKFEPPRNRAHVEISGEIGKLWNCPYFITIKKGTFAVREKKGLLEARVGIEKEKLVFHSCDIRRDEQRLHMTGEVGWDDRIDLDLEATGLRAGELSEILGLEKPVEGTITGRVQLTGRAGQPEAVLSLHLSDGFWRGEERFDRVRVQGFYSKNILEISGELHTKAAKRPLHYTMRLPARVSFRPWHLDLPPVEEWSSSVKVSGLLCEHLLPYITILDKVGGQMEAEVQGRGTLKQPVISATGSWRDGSFLAKEWPHLVEDIQVEWEADSKEITIKRAQMKHLGGRVSLKGKVNYPAFDEMRYDAEGSDLDVPGIFGIKGKVSGTARYAETTKGAELIGELRFSTAELKLGDFETDVAQQNIDIVDGKSDLVVIQGNEKDQDRYYNKLRMDLKLDLPPSGTWVRGEGLEAEISGSLRLEKVPFNYMRFFGGFRALRGSYTFQGNKLEIVDGEMAFSGGARPGPYLKIVCQKELKDVTVQVLVNGPLARPKLVFSSVPVMNQVDILSYLMFGHPAGDLSSDETVQLQARAASWLGSKTSKVLKNVFGKTPLTPDTLHYRSTGKIRDKGERSSNEEEEGGVVEIGKYITPDLYLTYEKGVMGGEDNQVQIEYRINRHLSIQTELGGVDRSGVDLFWRHDFGK